jgi:NAD-dependent dihydropyrimidine dehydrogenase PreA subunit
MERIDSHEAPDRRGPSDAAVRIDYDLCEDTGACTELCPEDVFERSGGHPRVVRPEACTECWICVENCVSGAIEIV